MLYHVEGIAAELEPSLAVIDCGGVGYALCCTANTVSNIRLGEKTKLYIYEAISENGYDLYGFAQKSERRCFEMLLSVSGIGPKAALSILSSNTPEGLALAIINGDEKALTAAQGIGKKIAQRVILELKDKVGKEMSASVVSAVPLNPSQMEDDVVSKAVTGLAVLGYSNTEIANVLKQVDINGMSVEQIIKAVLRYMVK